MEQQAGRLINLFELCKPSTDLYCVELTNESVALNLSALLSTVPWNKQRPCFWFCDFFFSKKYRILPAFMPAFQLSICSKSFTKQKCCSCPWFQRKPFFFLTSNWKTVHWLLEQQPWMFSNPSTEWPQGWYGPVSCYQGQTCSHHQGNFLICCILCTLLCGKVLFSDLNFNIFFNELFNLSCLPKTTLENMKIS